MAQGTPNYAITPALGVGSVTTGDTSRTSPTNVQTILAAGSSGSRIERIDMEGIGATIASMLRLFLYNGTSYFLWAEVPVGAITPSGTVAVWSQTLEAVTAPNKMPLLLPSGWSLRASINDTQTSSGVNVIAIGGNF